jgi:HK97 family phage major capsid protein
MRFPKIATHGVATQVIAQGTAIGGTDAVFDYLELGAYKYGQLTQVAAEVVQDSGVNIVDVLGRNIGRAVGRLVDADLMVGTGSGGPLGMMAAGTGAAGTVATGGTSIDPTYEKLVDLAYSVNDEYRSGGNAAWLMRDSTAGGLRKLRDGAGGTVGAVLWEPSLTAGIQNGQPDRLLGFPVYTDGNVAALASASISIGFGDYSAYYVRLVGGLVIERSDEYAFNQDLVTFRGKMRVDGDFIDLTAINRMRRAAS